jgi:L-lactate dehydrogenase complex protein LldG
VAEAGEIMSAREEILGRIRNANGGASTAERAHGAWDRLPRAYNRSARHEREAVLKLLEDRLRDYDATVVRCNLGNVDSNIADLLKQRGKRQMLVPPGIPLSWLPRGFEFVEDNGFTATELDRFEGVLTGATVAIAETGTVVLQNVAGQGRRAVSLVPDYHLCVVKMKDVVETVPEAMERLQSSANLATTFVSGPSATADIEMTRIKGVHGPRFLDVLLIG